MAATATLGLTADAAMAAASSPGQGARLDATVACGPACADFSSEVLGTGTIGNAYVPGDTGVIPGRLGQQVNMNYASNSHPNEDFIIRDVGTVASQCRSDTNPDGPLASNSVPCTAYRGLTAVELVWAPNGNESGYCMGTTGAGYSGQPVKLVGCGLVPGSLLIAQNSAAGPSTDGCTTGGTNTGPDFSAYISGATTPRFSHPLVLTVNPGTSYPINQIVLGQENTLTGGLIKDTQMFCYQAGPVTPTASPSPTVSPTVTSGGASRS